MYANINLKQFQQYEISFYLLQYPWSLIETTIIYYTYLIIIISPEFLSS